MKKLLTTALGIFAVTATTAIAITEPSPAQAQQACFVSSQVVPGCNCTYKAIGGQMVMVCCC
jgi:hypothetical protein